MGADDGYCEGVIVGVADGAEVDSVGDKDGPGDGAGVVRMGDKDGVILESNGVVGGLLFGDCVGFTSNGVVDGVGALIGDNVVGVILLLSCGVGVGFVSTFKAALSLLLFLLSKTSIAFFAGVKRRTITKATAPTRMKASLQHKRMDFASSASSSSTTFP